MARYNSVNTTGTTTTTGAFVTPDQGLFTTLSGTPGYTVTLADPDRSIGQAQTFYNASVGNITIAAPSGVIKGPGFIQAVTQIIPSNSTYTVTSDGDNFILTNNEGGPQQATTLTTSGTLTANGAVAFSPVNANIVMTPSGTGTVTINPTTSGTLNNVVIGGATAANGTFNTITINTSLTGNGTIDGGTY